MQDHYQHQREEVSEKLKKKARICQVLDILMMMSPIKLMTRSQLIYQQNENDIISFVNQNLSWIVKIWMMLIMVLVLKKILMMIEDDVLIEQFTAPDFDDFDIELDNEYPDSNLESDDS